MLVGLIRPAETQTLELEGDSLADVQQKARAAAPGGWDLLSVPVRMAKGTTALSATATLARRDAVREIQAEDMAALRAQVPEGWQLLSVRRT